MFHPVSLALPEHLAGRELTWTEVYNLRPVVMVSENLARELWGSPSAAIGKELTEFPKMPWHQVIGVVQDVRENGVQAKAPEIVYWPTMVENLFGQPGPAQAMRTVTFVVRSERAGTQGFLDEYASHCRRSTPTALAGTIPAIQPVYQQIEFADSSPFVMLTIAGPMALAGGSRRHLWRTISSRYRDTNGKWRSWRWYATGGGCCKWFSKRGATTRWRASRLGRRFLRARTTRWQLFVARWRHRPVTVRLSPPCSSSLRSSRANSPRRKRHGSTPWWLCGTNDRLGQVSCELVHTTILAATDER